MRSRRTLRLTTAAAASVYGEEVGSQFLELWRKHIDVFMQYAQARANGDDAAAEQAPCDLDGYRQDFGAFLASANPEVTANAVAQSLVPQVETLSAAIDAQVAGSSDAFAKLREAAGVMPEEAELLATAIAKQQGLSAPLPPRSAPALRPPRRGRATSHPGPGRRRTSCAPTPTREHATAYSVR